MAEPGEESELPNTLLEIRQQYEKICLEEEAVNQKLDELLSKGPEVGARLSSLKKFHSAFHLIEGDAKQLCSMTAFTSSLAESVSAKVRRLDVLKNRVSECQRRVEDLLDLQYCTEGVQTALQNEDYEQAAGHIHRFLSLDESSLTAVPETQDGSSLREAFKTLHESKAKLKEIISGQFDAAVREDDAASVERFFKIFPLLNMREDGLRKFSEYLRRKLRDAWQKAQRAGKDEPKRVNVKFADFLTVLLEETARVVEVHQPLVETYYGPGNLTLVVGELQKECDGHFAEVIDSFRRGRNFNATIAKAKAWLGKMAGASDARSRRRGHQSSADKLDPKATDAILGEVALFNARVALFTRFVRKRCLNDIDLAWEQDADRAREAEKLEKVIRDSKATRVMQEILGDYIALEEYYLRESIGKAVQVHAASIASASPAAVKEMAAETVKSVSPLVDDVFFIFQKCVRRAVTTENVDGFCAVMNIGCAVMEEEFCSMLRSALKQSFPTGYLDLSQAYNVLQSTIQQGKLQAAPDIETAKTTFLMHMNNAEMSVDYAESLRKKLTQEIAAADLGLTSKDQVKLDNSIGQLQTLVEQFRALMDLGMEQVKLAVVQPRIRPWVEGFISTSHNIGEEEFADYEANDPFVHGFILNLDGLLNSLKPMMAPGNYENLVIVLTAEVTAQLEKAVMKKTFSRLGGLQLDKEVRALVAYLSSMCTWGVREKFSRLTQMATLLNMERLSEVTEFWSSRSDSIVRLMSPSQLKQVLELREDFKHEEVRRLVL